MTQDEARKLVLSIQIMAQKARSNTLEALSINDEDSNDPMLSVVRDLHPTLFNGGGVQIIDLTERILAKDGVEPIDLYNLIVVCSLERAMQVMTVSYGKSFSIPSVDPIPSWIAGWDEERE